MTQDEVRKVRQLIEVFQRQEMILDGIINSPSPKTVLELQGLTTAQNQLQQAMFNLQQAVLNA